MVDTDSYPGTAPGGKQAPDFARDRHPLADAAEDPGVSGASRLPAERTSRPAQVGPYIGRIQQILEQDQAVPKKQRHTAKRIFERLQAEGYSGGYTQVEAKVRELRRLRQEVYMPLAHRPGEAQLDVGQALVKQ